jgi:heme o synthase
MAASNSTIKAAGPLTESGTLDRSSIAVYADLFKARLTLLVLLTTLVGYYVGRQGPLNLALLLHTVFGTAMVASGAAALNQLLERFHDARMSRTSQRPLPTGRITPRKALWVGVALSVAGIGYLALLVNGLAALLAFASWFLYVAVYTPLKRVTWLNTAVGAIPGGLPPLIGWVAARGQLGYEGLSLFAILAFWQIPHFLAIAWMYRKEYGKAGFVMLPAVDPTGRRTSRQALLTTLALFGLSLLPFAFGMAGLLYFVAALLLGGAFIWFTVKFLRFLDRPQGDRHPIRRHRAGFLLFGFMLMLMMRWQIAHPGEPVAHRGPACWRRCSARMCQRGIMSPDLYNSFGAMHGTIMVFLAVVPLAVGAFGNYLVPLQIGAIDMAFPR